MTEIVPGFTYRQITNNYRTEHWDWSRGLVLHVATYRDDLYSREVGANASLYGYFCNPDADASSHWFSGADRVSEQYMDPLEHVSFAQADGNNVFHSWETGGNPDEPLTERQINDGARIYAWGHRVFGWPFQLSESPSQPGLGWHGMGGSDWGGHIYCPGEIRKGQRAEILRRAQVLANGGAMPASSKPASTTNTTTTQEAGVSAADVNNALNDPKGVLSVHRDDPAHGVPAQTVSLRDDIVNGVSAAYRTDFRTAQLEAKVADLTSKIDRLIVKMGA